MRNKYKVSVKGPLTLDANIWMLGTGRKVSPVHRLDRAASGVMIFSKTSDATRAAQFALSHPASIKE
jgi:23S rRNA-/tRNA-specific pseudouridylate synthase